VQQSAAWGHTADCRKMTDMLVAENCNIFFKIFEMIRAVTEFSNNGIPNGEVPISNLSNSDVYLEVTNYF
jgi:hypothetical protein